MYYSLKELSSKAPEIKGLTTYTKLDEMFYSIELVENKIIKKSLGGIPQYSVLNITGIPDTGKSVFGEQFAVVQASFGKKVLYITVESPAKFLYNSMKVKSFGLGLNFDDLEENIFVIDVTENESLRENIVDLIKTMKYAITSQNIEIVVIDSVSGFYEDKEVIARSIVRKLYNFMKKMNQTALFITQKRSVKSAESADVAGGLAIAHILDGTIVFDKKLIETKYDMNLYGLPMGNVLRTLRIDGCRMCGHDQRSWVFRITDFGTIEVLEPLSEFLKKRWKNGNNKGKRRKYR